MLSRTNRWLNWICLIETVLNTSRDLTFKRPESNFQFHHRFCLWEDYLLIPQLGSSFFKCGDQDSCFACGEGSKKQFVVPEIWETGTKQIQAELLKGILASLLALPRSLEWVFLQGHFYCPLSFTPSSEKPEAAGFPHRRRVCGWLSWSHTQPRRVKNDCQAWV